jgi:hypothetical protein
MRTRRAPWPASAAGLPRLSRHAVQEALHQQRALLACDRSACYGAQKVVGPAIGYRSSIQETMPSMTCVAAICMPWAYNTRVLKSLTLAESGRRTWADMPQKHTIQIARIARAQAHGFLWAHRYRSTTLPGRAHALLLWVSRSYRILGSPVHAPARGQHHPQAPPSSLSQARLSAGQGVHAAAWHMRNSSTLVLESGTSCSAHTEATRSHPPPQRRRASFGRALLHSQRGRAPAWPGRDGSISRT